MHPKSFFAFLIAFCFSLSSCNPKTETVRVIVFGVDGMSPDGVNKANTPNMHYMMEHGAYTLHARGVLPTSSSPNWAAMVMGAGPEQHGITNNAWQHDEQNYPPVVAGDEGLFPTIFGVVRKAKPDAEIGVIHDWEDFARLVEKTKVNYIKREEGPYKTVTEAIRYIHEKKPDFLFMHLDHVDDAGHTFSHGSQKYYDAVSLADSLLGVLMDACKKENVFDNTVFIVTADHGGVGFGHGGESLAELEIPFIVFGKGIKSGYEITRPVFQYDNAATVAYAFNAATPQAWIGKAVTSAFAKNPDDIDDGFGKRLIDAPSIISGVAAGEPAGGLYIDSIPKVVITAEKNISIRYTTDGSEPDKNSTLYTSPFPVSTTTAVKAKSFDKTGNESLVAKAFYRVVKSQSLHPLHYNYYEITEEEFLPDFNHLTPVKKGTCNEFGLAEISNRGTQFALKMEGYIKIDTAGEYKFYTESDDGSKLFIDDKLVVNNDGNHGTKEKDGSVKLSSGFHKITVTYFNGGGGRAINVYYKIPGTTKRVIPVDVLYGSVPK